MGKTPRSSLDVMGKSALRWHAHLACDFTAGPPCHFQDSSLLDLTYCIVHRASIFPDVAHLDLNQFGVGKDNKMVTILIILLVLLLLGAVPVWPYSRRWGYWPSGGLGLILLIVLILVLLQGI